MKDDPVSVREAQLNYQTETRNKLNLEVGSCGDTVAGITITPAGQQASVNLGLRSNVGL